MTRALLIARREVLTFLRDKGDLAFSLLLPIAIFAITYGAFGGGGGFHGTAHIVNEDPKGAYSTMLLERLRGVNNLDLDLLTAKDADSKLDKSDLLFVIFIPPDFSDKLASGEQAQLIFKQRGNGGQEGQIVASIVSGVVEKIAQDAQISGQVQDALSGKGVPADRIETTVQRILQEESKNPTVSVSEDTVGSRPDPVSQSLPGIVTMFVLFAVTMSARAIVEERKKGTLERLLTTRASIQQLFVGKFLANMSRAFIQSFILLALAYAVFQLFTPLSFVEALAIALVFSAAVSSLGLVIGSWARSEEQATWTSVFFTMVMVMLSGTFFTITAGSVFYYLSKASVNTYANNAFKTLIVDHGSLANLGLELGVLAGVAIVGLAVARMLFKVVPGGR
jgi:ABC-2 type transport system permease protein